jgi:hypothetical protein
MKKVLILVALIVSAGLLSCAGLPSAQYERPADGYYTHTAEDGFVTLAYLWAGMVQVYEGDGNQVGRTTYGSNQVRYGDGYFLVDGKKFTFSSEKRPLVNMPGSFYYGDPGCKYGHFVKEYSDGWSVISFSRIGIHEYAFTRGKRPQIAYYDSRNTREIEIAKTSYIQTVKDGEYFIQGIFGEPYVYMADEDFFKWTETLPSEWWEVLNR